MDRRRHTANRISTAELIDRLPDILARMHTGGEHIAADLEAIHSLDKESGPRAGGETAATSASMRRGKLDTRIV